MGQFFGKCFGSIEEDENEESYEKFLNDKYYDISYDTFDSIYLIVDEKLKEFPKIRNEVKKKIRNITPSWENIPHRGTFNRLTKKLVINSRYKGYSVSIGILLHELIHAINGTELDAEFFENVLCLPEEGAVEPTQHPTKYDDFDDFRDMGRKKVTVIERKLDHLGVLYYIKVEFKGKSKVFRKNP